MNLHRKARQFIQVIMIVTIATTAARSETGAPNGIAGLEFGAGFLGTLEREIAAIRDEDDLTATWSVVPWLEWPLGKIGGIGTELNFIWAKGDYGNADRRLILSPHFRLRLGFPIANKFTFDAFLSLGPTWWTSSNEQGSMGENRFGYAIRTGFGGSFAINEVVNLYLHLGHMSSTTYGGDIEASISYIPLHLGLRAVY